VIQGISLLSKPILFVVDDYLLRLMNARALYLSVTFDGQDEMFFSCSYTSQGCDIDEMN